MSLFELFEQIVAAEGKEIELTLPEEGINLLTLEILKKEAGRRGKTLKLRSSGPRSKRLITLLEEGAEPEPIRIIRGGRFGLPKIHLDLAFIKRVGLIPLLLLGILLLLGGGGWWGLNYLPRAEVVLTLKPIPMVKEIAVSADTQATEIDAEKGLIPGTKLTIEEEGQKSTPATGTATVGEKAKGTVTFINCNDTTDVTFTAGTQIKPVGKNLIYVIDSNVVGVPKRVGEICGTKDGTVTAEKIGPSYNLADATNFDFVTNYSNSIYDAGSATGAISGGESHEVTIVASADQAKVLDELKKELLDKGKTDLADQAGLDQVVIQEVIKQEVVEEKFAQAVGEQAEEVGLTLKMKFTVIVYKDEDLKGLVSQVLGGLVPENYELFPSEMEIETLEPKLGDKKLDFSAKIAAQVVPKLDLEGIKRELSARDVASAQEYLASLSNVSAYELRLWPNLPEDLRRIPRSTKRINVKLRTETEED